MENRILVKGMEGTHPLLHRRAGPELQFNSYFVLLKLYPGHTSPWSLGDVVVFAFCVLRWLCFLFVLLWLYLVSFTFYAKVSLFNRKKNLIH